MLTNDQINAYRGQLGIPTAPSVTNPADLRGEDLANHIMSVGGTQSSQNSPSNTGSLFPSQPGDSSLTTAIKTTGNVVPDFLKTTFYDLPKGAAENVAKIPGEVSGLVKESGGIVPAIKNFLSAGVDPQTYINDLKAIIPSAAQKIVKGDFNGAATDIANHPFQQIAPFLLTLEQGAKAMGSDAVDTGISKVARTTGIPQATEAIPSAINSVKSSITSKFGGTPAPENVDQFITDNYSKAIKPTVGGKNTPAQQDIYNKNVVSAVKSIISNKGGLELLDENGDPTGKLPQTPQQFVDAQQQTKSAIFKQYDALQKAAGEKGATVDLTPLAQELRTFADNPVIQDNHPEAASYAKQQADLLENRNSYDTQQAQDAIKIRNDKLNAFYRNPTPGDVGKSGVDSLIANGLRKGLDSVIENASPEASQARSEENLPSYQDLKKQYGALKSVEKDILRAAQRQAKGAPSGLIDTLTNVGSGVELVKGLMRLNPADVASSIAIKGIGAFTKYLNSPNRLIQNMFEGADSAISSGATSQKSTSTPSVQQKSTSSPRSPKGGK